MERTARGRLVTERGYEHIVREMPKIKQRTMI